MIATGSGERRRGGAINALESPDLDFFRGGLRRSVLVEEPRLRFGDVCFGDAEDREELLAPKRPLNLDLVADLHDPMGLRLFTVDADLPELAGLLRLRPGLEDAGHVEPRIQTDINHQFSLMQPQRT